MTPQHIFNKAFVGVIAQGKLSKNDDHTGGYYLMSSEEDKVSCGIGHLIDKETASVWDSLTGNSITRIIADGLSEKYSWMSENIDLLADIQAAHDMSHTIDEYVDSMIGLLEKYGLENKIKISEIESENETIDPREK